MSDVEVTNLDASEDEVTTKSRRGRPPYGEKPMSSGIYIRCSEEQKEAITQYVENLNNDLQKEGLPRIDVSSWIRELALKHTGNSHLGMAAQAARLSKAFTF